MHEFAKCARISQASIEAFGKVGRRSLWHGEYFFAGDDQLSHFPPLWAADNKEKRAFVYVWAFLYTIIQGDRFSKK